MNILCFGGCTHKLKKLLMSVTCKEISSLSIHRVASIHNLLTYSCFSVTFSRCKFFKKLCDLQNLKIKLYVCMYVADRLLKI